MDQVKWNVNFILNETVETIIRGKDVAKSCKGKSRFEKTYKIFCDSLKLSLIEVYKIKIAKV